MHRVSIWYLTLVFASPAAHAQMQCDTVVYGATSAGIVAAVQTARMGRSVVVIDPDSHLGGLTTSGLGWTDSGDKRAVGGIAREFYQRVKQHYDSPDAWRFGQREVYPQYRPDDDAMWTFEPKVAAAIFRTMLDEHSIRVIEAERLNRPTGVQMVDRRIASITCESGATYAARMFIDATYEGDLMAAAGVSYTVGREPSSEYGETLAGVQTKRNVHAHRFVVDVDPFVVADNSASGLLPGIEAGTPAAEGTGDHRVQAYCFRLCLSKDPTNRVAFVKPAGYNPLDFELLLRNFEAGDRRLPMTTSGMPNGKTDTNNNGAASTDLIGANYAYPEASYAERAKTVDRHEAYQRGLMWTLAHHPRVPQAIRDQMSQWGLAKDEFVDNQNWPPQIYVREARRMTSDYVMTEHDCRSARIADDPVGMGSYNIDSHNCQRYVTAAGLVQNEGDIQVPPGGPYLISYRSIIPRRGEAKNLLVPCCISASHIAYGSIRMEPVFMVLGQSAATAAVLAMDRELDVQDLDYRALEQHLLADGQVLRLEGE